MWLVWCPSLCWFTKRWVWINTWFFLGKYTLGKNWSMIPLSSLQKWSKSFMLKTQKLKDGLYPRVRVQYKVLGAHTSTFDYWGSVKNITTPVQRTGIYLVIKECPNGFVWAKSWTWGYKQRYPNQTYLGLAHDFFYGRWIHIVLVLIVHWDTTNKRLLHIEKIIEEVANIRHYSI